MSGVQQKRASNRGALFGYCLGLTHVAPAPAPYQPPPEGEEYFLPSLREPGAHAVGGGEGFA